METPPLAPPKPVSKFWRPELTRLPPLHRRRRLFRAVVRFVARLLIGLLTRPSLHGLEKLPASGPALIVMNHLGDADTALVLAGLPRAPEALGKLELLYEFPVLGRLMEWYGTIWVHRGQPDRRALRCALDALANGRVVVVAPEGRYTLTHGLERGSSGAVYVAIKAGVPLIPMALTGTENPKIYGSLRRLRRPPLSLTVGDPIPISAVAESPRGLKDATEQMMRALARLLPPEYRGVYAEAVGQV